MTIHKEGRKLLFTLLIVLTTINWMLAVFVPVKSDFQYLVLGFSIAFFIATLQFFRNPSVKANYEDNQVIAPADGKVVVVEETTEGEYFNDKRIQVSIFMSPINVHINRSPVSGTVTLFKYHPGRYHVAWNPKSSMNNERTTMVLRMLSGTEVLVRQIAGAMARRIKWYIEEGSGVGQGQEFGFIKFGSRVDVFLPTDAVLKVSPGTKTKAGKTVLAEFT